jgi:adenine deaminase
MYLYVEIRGRIVDVFRRKIFKGGIRVESGKIIEIREYNNVPDVFIIPGFVDAHIHVESSLLVPSEFAKMAVAQGCVACLCDPHEIANVIGIEGIEFLLENAKRVNFKFYFGAPPCVPATIHEESGGKIGVEEIENLLRREEIKFLSEVMDIEGVITRREDLMRKIEVARALNKRIDGHAPGLRGEILKRYMASGVSTDHEVSEIDEGEEKIEKGMKVMIRYGSLSKDLERLLPLVKEHPEKCMLCSDDIGPDELGEDYLRPALKSVLRKNVDIFDAINFACTNAVLHYGLDVGLLRVNDPGDFLIIDDFENLRVLETYINGVPVFSYGQTNIEGFTPERINNFSASKKGIEDIRVVKKGERIRVIEAKEKSLFTGSSIITPKIEGNFVVSDTERDVLKVVLVNRYRKDERVAFGFVRGFGLKSGAIASSFSHDSHHLLALGCDDSSIVEALNLVIEERGGMVFVSKKKKEVLPLPVAGLMSDLEAREVGKRYKRLSQVLKDNGVSISHPFMLLSFLALPVIPELKITSKGLFDVKEQKVVDLFV